MTPSKYEPGEEPDVCEAHGRALPCIECQVEHMEQRADWQHDERKERA
jgi:hypothetical protein